MAKIRPVEKELSGQCPPANSFGWQHSIVASDWSWVGSPGGIYALFQEMEDNDAHLFATLQTRKNALLACPWNVVAADDSPRALEAAAVVEQNIATLPSLNTALFHLLDGISKGFSVAEIIWEIDAASGRVRAADIRARNQAHFAFDRAENLYMLAGPGDRTSNPATASAALADNLLPRPGDMVTHGLRGIAMPARKFLHYTFQGNACSPYGSALCIKAYRYYWLKKNTLQYWALFNEKFGSPTAVARYNSETTEEELQHLEDSIRSLPRDSGVILPESVALEFLEARRAAGSNSYREMADWCNDEISKIVLGQTLTTSEGRRSGSLALGRVHETVRRDYLVSDAMAVGQLLTAQLSRWITDFNFGINTPAPRIVFDVDPPEKFEAELAVDRELIRMGVPLAADYFYQRYRRPVPADGERTLRYDDANLYQYHLLHGVLTINEVRRTLGLDEVDWGNKPTGGNLQPRGDGTGLPRIPGSPETEGNEDEPEADEATADRRVR